MLLEERGAGCFLRRVVVVVALLVVQHADVCDAFAGPVCLSTRMSSMGVYSAMTSQRSSLHVPRPLLRTERTNICMSEDGTEREAVASEYALIDSGNFKRLEQFGPLRVQRPCPSAAWNVGDAKAWVDVDLTYKVPSVGKSTAAQQGEWKGMKKVPLKVLKDWRVSFGDSGVELGLSTSESGQVGVFAEQLGNWKFIRQTVRAALDAGIRGGPPAKTKADAEEAEEGETQSEKTSFRVINGFAYTGGSTLAAARAAPGVQVTHLDGSKSAVEWAKRNAEAIGVPQTAVRWMSEDCLTFVQREVKRGNKYEGLIFDPPAFGRGGSGKSAKAWKLDKDLPKLTSLFVELLSDQASFVVLTCHDPKFSSEKLAKKLEEALAPVRAARGGEIEHGPMMIATSIDKGRDLPMGVYARWRAAAVQEKIAS